MGSVITVQSEELDRAEHDVVVAAEAYIALRDRQSSAYWGMLSDTSKHTSLEGYTLNQAVKALDAIRHSIDCKGC